MSYEIIDRLRVVFEKQETRIHELVGKCDELEQENDKLHKELEDYVFSTTNYEKSRWHDSSRGQREFDGEF